MQFFKIKLIFFSYNSLGDKMKIKYNIFAFAVIGILGALSHFVYEWKGENIIVGYFFATNESTWEHLKLLFFPTLFYSGFEYCFAKEKPKNYIPSVTFSLIIGMLSIIVLFYTYSGVLGFTIDFINILIYYISLIIMLVCKNKFIPSQKFLGSNYTIFSFVVLFVIALLFIFFTYNPPKIALFIPPTM